MKRTIPKEFKQAFLVYENDLRNLYKFLKESFDEINIHVECSDNSHFEPLDIDELLEYENPNYRKIIIIMFTMKSLEQTCLLKIGTQPEQIAFSNSALIEIKINDINKEGVFSELNKKLQELKPWYSILTYWDFTWLLPIIIFIPITILAIYKNLEKAIPKIYNDINTTVVNQVKASSVFTDSEGTAIILLILLIVLLIGYSIQKFKSYLFPKIFFEIGKQKNILSRINFWRITILSSLLIGITGSIIASYIMK